MFKNENEMFANVDRGWEEHEVRAEDDNEHKLIHRGWLNWTAWDDFYYNQYPKMIHEAFSPKFWGEAVNEERHSWSRYIGGSDRLERILG